MSGFELDYMTERELRMAIAEWRAAGEASAVAAGEIAESIDRLCERLGDAVVELCRQLAESADAASRSVQRTQRASRAPDGGESRSGSPESG